MKHQRYTLYVRKYLPYETYERVRAIFSTEKCTVVHWH